jgi:hypothetical protein
VNPRVARKQTFHAAVAARLDFAHLSEMFTRRRHLSLPLLKSLRSSLVEKPSPSVAFESELETLERGRRVD